MKFFISSEMVCRDYFTSFVYVERMYIGFEGRNIGIEVLDVILQGIDGVVKCLVTGVRHLGGRQKRSGWVGGTMDERVISDKYYYDQGEEGNPVG
jgi:hypothetical protein